ncbi:MBL fold metallo-hydrolase [Phenylobacterium sp. LjRoot225]|uniref:alkyl sulfatase dimerization domain-containing protein n=1 Tax=Phenylobacterium sp. LjRoot225 TaxID=3342285 RepID=UPI003ECDD5D1
MADQPENALIIRAGDGVQDAVALGHDIYMSRDISNAYRVVTPAGDVIINTGMVWHEHENARRLGAVSANPIAKIIFTQSHDDHIGGWRSFNQPGTETIAQANFAHVRGYWTGLGEAMTRRSRHLWARDQQQEMTERPEPAISTTFHDTHSFELGGRRFELLATPGGETLDSLVVWMPQDRVVFTGNLTGPLFGHVPNLYTLRGDKIRYVQWWLDGVQRVIDLEPEVLITGHGDPIRGGAEIRRQLSRIRDAVQHLKDRTFEGMNAGVDLWTLMGQIKLPPELDVGQGHGKVPWIIRAIWEEHLGWFRFESTTELYNVPLGAVSADLVELAGGPAPVVARGRQKLAENRPLEAIHLAEAALAKAPADPGALSLKLAATEQLLASSTRENFSEVRWLESEVRRLRAAVEGPAQ